MAFPRRRDCLPDTAFQERHIRRHNRLPTPYEDEPRKPSGIRSSAGICPSSIVQLRGDQAQTIVRVGSVALGADPLVGSEMIDRNPVASDRPPALRPIARNDVVGFVWVLSWDDRHPP